MAHSVYYELNCRFLSTHLAWTPLELALGNGEVDGEDDFLQINRFNAKRHVRPIPLQWLLLFHSGGRNVRQLRHRILSPLTFSRSLRWFFSGVWMVHPWALSLICVTLERIPLLLFYWRELFTGTHFYSFSRRAKVYLNRYADKFKVHFRTNNREIVGSGRRSSTIPGRWCSLSIIPRKKFQC